MKNLKVKNYFFSTLVVGYFSFIVYGCTNDNNSSTSSSTNSTMKGPAKSEEPKAKATVINEETIKQYLIGKWQLDSIERKLINEKQSALPKHAKIRNDSIIVVYQTKYNKAGDNVQIEEYNSNGKQIITSIDQNSVKHKSTGKEISTEDYIISGNNIVFTLKWGKNKENETKSIDSVIKIDSQNLIYISEDVNLTCYFSKLNK